MSLYIRACLVFVCLKPLSWFVLYFVHEWSVYLGFTAQRQNSSPFIDILKVRRVSMCMPLNIQASLAWLGLLGLQELQGLLVSLGLREELETLD